MRRNRSQLFGYLLVSIWHEFLEIPESLIELIYVPVHPNTIIDTEKRHANQFKMVF